VHVFTVAFATDQMKEERFVSAMVWAMSGI